MRDRHLLGRFLMIAILAGCSATSDGGEPRMLTVLTRSGPLEGIEDDGVF
jgi:hypothetical protein